MKFVHQNNKNGNFFNVQNYKDIKKEMSYYYLPKENNLQKRLNEISEKMLTAFYYNRNSDENMKMNYPMIIFYGNLGIGKTLSTKNLFFKLTENLSSVNKDSSCYIKVDASDILDKYVGGNEKNIKDFFNLIDNLIKKNSKINQNSENLKNYDDQNIIIY